MDRITVQRYPALSKVCSTAGGNLALRSVASLYISPGLSAGASSGAEREWLDTQCAGAPWLKALDRVEAMFVIQLPASPALTYAGSTFLLAGRTLSATGIDPSPRTALARMAAEIWEAIADGGRPDPMAGHGAAEDLVSASLHAILEFAERTLVRAWWAGELLPCQPSSTALAAFVEAHRSWGAVPGRIESLLCLSRNPIPPVLVAWSTDGAGRGFAFGAACRQAEAEATLAAFRELRQMHYGLSLVAHRRASGAEIGSTDHVRLERAIHLDTRNDARFLATGQAPPSAPITADLNALVARMQSVGVDLLRTQLTDADAAIQVVRAERRVRAPPAEDDPYGIAGPGAKLGG